MTILNVSHKTVYRYAKPVRFGDHRMMLRPRDSHDLRLLDTSLSIAPTATVRWLHDAFGNSIAIASFADLMSDELVFHSAFRAEHFPLPEPSLGLELESYARTYPFSYPVEDVPDLARAIERHYPDPEHALDAWVRRTVDEAGTRDTAGILIAMTRAINRQFEYLRREQMGTQAPAETLRRGSGTCRDFALFMMEAARCLGLAARFVSGYLYDETQIDPANPLAGGGATHAWMQIYLPGAGWTEFDPTNALAGGRNLVRVAVARDPTQAVPLSGTYIGAPADFLDMRIEVTVTAQ
ncbi:MAG: transglutaminase family protein [Alphaproteobacteria bacterium]|nr:transglutaminase family protein [Alphaproteobacteria bacterium]